MRNSGGSRNFKTGKGGGSRSSGRILGAGDCFDATSSMSYVFVVRVGNKIHIVHIEF